MTAGLDLDGLAVAVQPDRQARIVATVAMLRAVCVNGGIFINKHDAVSQLGAAELIGLNAKTLRNWRAPSCKLPEWQRLKGRKIGPRLTYSLEEIAGWYIDNAEN